MSVVRDTISGLVRIAAWSEVAHLGDVFHQAVLDEPNALIAWERARGAAAATGHWPVLRDGPELFGPYTQQAAAGRPAGEIVREALAIDPLSWFDEIQDELVAGLEEELAESIEVDDPEAIEEISERLEGDRFRGFRRGPWPDHPVRVTPAQNLVDSRRGPPFFLTLVPTVDAWKCPAMLRFGGWNQCPPPQTGLVFLKTWFETFQAETLVVAGDRIELVVGRPPTGREAALELARQHDLFCPDLLDGGGTLDELAARLLDSRLWTFRWD